QLRYHRIGRLLRCGFAFGWFGVCSFGVPFRRSHFFAPRLCRSRLCRSRFSSGRFSGGRLRCAGGRSSGGFVVLGDLPFEIGSPLSGGRDHCFGGGKRRGRFFDLFGLFGDGLGRLIASFGRFADRFVLARQPLLQFIVLRCEPLQLPLLAFEVTLDLFGLPQAPRIAAEAASELSAVGLPNLDLAVAAGDRELLSGGIGGQLLGRRRQL